MRVIKRVAKKRKRRTQRFSQYLGEGRDEMKETFTAWAIDTQSKEGHGLIGRYWWFNHNAPVIPPQFEGCKTAIFKTRELARENLDSVRETFQNARVVKAKVTIEV